MNMTRLQQLYDELGQSPWLDNLKRGYITSGQLHRVRLYETPRNFADYCGPDS